MKTVLVLVILILSLLAIAENAETTVPTGTSDEDKLNYTFKATFSLFKLLQLHVKVELKQDKVVVILLTISW